MAEMQAVRIHRFGGPEVLRVEAIPVPEPAADEVLLRIHAASINPVDLKTRAGEFPLVGADRLPMTLGRDVAATIERAGDAAGVGASPGEAVIAMLATDRGGQAEYALAKPDQLAPMPTGIDPVTAASVPLAALTAWQGLFDHGRLAPGQRVLIHGGAGGVGHFAVQFAVWRGAEVFATAGAADLAFLRERGATAIDYKAERFEAVATEIDLVLDLIAGETQARSFAVLRRGGRLISTLQPPPQEQAAAHGVQGGFFLTAPRGDQLTEIAGLVSAGRVHPTVAATYPLAEVAAAHERQAKGGFRGKIVLTVGG